MSNDLMKNLNEQQRRAVREVEHPLLIIAGAGSGKTKVITHKIAHLITDLGIPPAAILGVTFTNKAANEMKERVEKLTGNRNGRPLISTFHAFGLRLLRENAREGGFDSGWGVIDAGEQKNMIHRLIRDKYDSLPRDVRNAMVRKINRAKMNLLYPNNIQMLEDSGFHPTEAQIYLEYYRQAVASKRWDYEDLISLPVRMLHSSPRLQQKYADRFRYILVDEFQDTNPNQYELVGLMARGKPAITVVGDDDQAIYSWRGANVRFLFQFEKDFPNARIIKLERNYRSTQPILRFANELIIRNRRRKSKRMWTDKEKGRKVCLMNSYSREDEAEKVADLVEICREKDPECFPLCILYRTNAQSLPFETVFSRRNIAFRILKGQRFFDRREVKDSLSLLKLAMDPADDYSFYRMADVLPLGVGARSREALAEKAREGGEPVFTVFRREMPKKFKAHPLFETLSGFHEQESPGPPAAVLERLLDASGYLQILDRRRETGRKLNIRELVKFLIKWQRKNPDRPFHELMDFIHLNEGESSGGAEGKVILSTMHNAKGLEFPGVVVAGVNGAYMPFSRRREGPEIEEERRLFYVAATRAIKKLVISTGSMYPSRFLDDVPRDCYIAVRSAAEILSEAPAVSRSGEAEGVKEDKVILTHPLFGRGEVLDTLDDSRYFVRFEDGREIVIDTSLVDVSFVS